MGMHIYFSGIGGAGLSGLALIAKKAGYTVSGSDKQDSRTIAYLKEHGVTDIHIGQSREAIEALHASDPIDWLVYSSAVSMESADVPELQFCKEMNIRTSKRDEFLNQVITDKHLKLIAVAGTHGKSTTTAMLIWLFTCLELPIGYNVGAKLAFGGTNEFAEGAEYFVYECDEFDRNFLAFKPYLSIISGVSWDHHEIFPTREDYQQAFRDFIGQSKRTRIWDTDAEYLGLAETTEIAILNSNNSEIESLEIKGRFPRLDAWQAIQAVHNVTDHPIEDLVGFMNNFPGLLRRMERVAPNLYSDYAHTPEKIRGAMSVALEMAADQTQEVVVIFEPLTNRRQHFMMNDYKDCFEGAAQVYWVPSYLAREDPTQRIIPPDELITRLSDPSIAVPADMDDDLKRTILSHLERGDMVIAMSGGGGNSLDEWLRQQFQA